MNEIDLEVNVTFSNTTQYNQWVKVMDHKTKIPHDRAFSLIVSQIAWKNIPIKPDFRWWCLFLGNDSPPADDYGHAWIWLFIHNMTIKYFIRHMIVNNVPSLTIRPRTRTSHNLMIAVKKPIHIRWNTILAAIWIWWLCNKGRVGLMSRMHIDVFSRLLIFWA